MPGLEARSRALVRYSRFVPSIRLNKWRVSVIRDGWIDESMSDPTCEVRSREVIVVVSGGEWKAGGSQSSSGRKRYWRGRARRVGKQDREGFNDGMTGATLQVGEAAPGLLPTVQWRSE